MTTVTVRPNRRTVLALTFVAAAGLAVVASGRSAPSPRDTVGPTRTTSVERAAAGPAQTVRCVATVPRQYLAHYYPSGYSYSLHAWGDGASPNEPADEARRP